MPGGKLPAVTLDSGELLGDSQRILERLGAPGLVLPLLLKQVRGKVATQLNGQGIGRMAPAQIAEHGVNGYAALAEFLGDKPYMLGDRPSALDATAFGFLHTLLVPPFASPIKAYAASQPNLVAYHQRMLAAFEAKAGLLRS